MTDAKSSGFKLSEEKKKEPTFNPKKRIRPHSPEKCDNPEHDHTETEGEGSGNHKVKR